MSKNHLWTIHYLLANRPLDYELHVAFSKTHDHSSEVCKGTKIKITQFVSCASGPNLKRYCSGKSKGIWVCSKQPAGTKNMPRLCMQKEKWDQLITTIHMCTVKGWVEEVYWRPWHLNKHWWLAYLTVRNTYFLIILNFFHSSTLRNNKNKKNMQAVSTGCIDLQNNNIHGVSISYTIFASCLLSSYVLCHTES